MGDDDKKLFEEALASMSPADVFRGKFGAPVPKKDSEDERDESAETTSREEIQRLREQREMENAFAGVERIDSTKYHAPAPKHAQDDQADALRAEFEAAMQPERQVAEPEPPPRVSLEKSAPPDVHSINLRGFDEGKALSQLGLFVDFAAKDGHQLIRVRIGSNPDLLKAIKSWFEGPGISYVLELEIAQPHGDAAIFARIRRMNPS